MEYAVHHQQHLKGLVISNMMEHHYVLHVCRMPLDEWPDPVTRSVGHINPSI
jgi:hypothetical protein